MSIRLLPQSTLPRVEFGPLSCGMKHRLFNQPVHVFFFSHRHKKNHLSMGIKSQSAIAKGTCPWRCLYLYEAMRLHWLHPAWCDEGESAVTRGSAPIPSSICLVRQSTRRAVGVSKVHNVPLSTATVPEASVSSPLCVPRIASSTTTTFSAT